MPPPPAPARLCFAAAHVVLADSYRALGHRLDRPGRAEQFAAHVDWPRTMAFRRHLDANGFGVAEAMDTAQRFFLGWPLAAELIARTGALRLQHGFVAGAGADQLAAVERTSRLVDAVVAQCHHIRHHGGIPMILPMPWLCAQRLPERAYVEVYGAIFAQVEGPVFVHWLGEMFLPELAGYFPGDSFRAVMALAPDKVRGCKLSLLDDARELQLRRELLPRDQIVLTGDDFHFGRLLLGGDPRQPAPPTAPPIERWTAIGPHRVALGDFSHALLGVFDGIAEPAGRALAALTGGDVAGYLRIMDACEQLGRHVFTAPTRHYKAGLAFLAFLNGHQDQFLLLNGEELARDRAHYLRCHELAAACGALRDPAAAAVRLQSWLEAP